VRLCLVHEMRRIAKKWRVLTALVLGSAGAAGIALGQSATGPIAVKPDVQIQQPPKNAQGKAKVQVTLVSTPVTVRDRKGEMVHDLDAPDFKITDNGKTQQISHFDIGGDPLSLVILLETSSRIEPMLPQIRKTGILFTQTVMGAHGEAAVVGFNDSVDRLQNFTTNGDLIEGAVAHLAEGTSGLRLYDAMSLGVEMLSGRADSLCSQPGAGEQDAKCIGGMRRRVLFIVSEATDVGSDAKLGEVLRQAQLANVTIYSVGLSTTRAELQEQPADTRPQVTPPGTFPMPAPPGTVQTPTSEENRYGSGNIDLMAAAVWAVKHARDQVKSHALEIASAATGGQHLATFKDRSIDKAVDEIGGELHSQYAISYVPSDSNVSGYHEIRVSVVRKDAKGLKVQARPGYYLESEN
jgi:VWFA-related protein